MKIATVTPAIRLADVEYNVSKIISLMNEAQVSGADILVFPAMTVCGVSCGHLLKNETLMVACEEAIQNIARASGNMVTVFGAPLYCRDDCCGGSFMPAVFMARNGKIRKTSYSGFKYKNFTVLPASDPETVFDNMEMAFAGYENMVYVAPGKGESVADSIRTGRNIVKVKGKIVAFTRMNEDVITYTDTLSCLEVSVPKALCGSSKNPFVPEKKEDRILMGERVLDLQSYALVQRLQSIHASELVLGLSGGLDSTLALLVCSEAMKKMNLPASCILAVTMPCFGTTEKTKSNAEILAAELGCSFRCINIKDAVEQHFKDIGHDGKTFDSCYENAQARERTQVLMDLANMTGGIVVGTGDMSEIALGWATYNGDHMSMYGVNGTVPKTLVRETVRAYSQRADISSQVRKTLEDVIDLPVSPELVPGKQETESIVGPYELHDFFLWYFVYGNEDSRCILEKAYKEFSDSYSKEEIKKWYDVFISRFFSQQFKRSCMPEGVGVLPFSLSPRTGFLMPCNASSVLWKNNKEE